MWSNLRKMLADCLGSRTQRRASPPRFRGQFEPLESRTVLSATIGMMAIDFEANTVTIAVAVWESPSFSSTRPPLTLPGDAPLRAFGSANSAWRPDGGDRFFHENMFDMRGDSGVDAGGFSAKPPLRATASVDNDQPLRSQAPTQPDLDTGPLNFHFNADPPGGFAPSTFTQIRYSRSLPSSAILDGAAIAASSTPTSSLPERSRLVTTVTAIDKYTPDSLLLATADQLDDDAPDDKSGDADSLDDSEKPADEAADSFAAEEVAASLDALQRERMAIDAVLERLHEVKLKDGHEQQPTAIEQHRSTDSRTAAIEHFSPDERNANARDAIPADGGMVLLQPTGDPNSSAYDLADVFFARLGGDDRAPLAVEASLGMYQAIDVGAQPAVSRPQLPIAQPAQNGNPSVSAENAPAKKSEQPT